VTHAWTEDGQPRTETVSAGAGEKTYVIQAGKDVRNQSVTIEMPSEK
jgi:hypothetical protein